LFSLRLAGPRPPIIPNPISSPQSTSWPRLVPATHQAASNRDRDLLAGRWVAGTSRGHDVVGGSALVQNGIVPVCHQWWIHRSKAW